MGIVDVNDRSAHPVSQIIWGEKLKRFMEMIIIQNAVAFAGNEVIRAFDFERWISHSLLLSGKPRW